MRIDAGGGPDYTLLVLQTQATYVAFAVLVLAGPVRAAFRLRAQIKSVERAFKLGPVTCPHCAHRGALFGYGTFFAQQRLRCAKCRRVVTP